MNAAVLLVAGEEAGPREKVQELRHDSESGT